GSDIGNDLKFDYDGNLFMTGHFRDTVNFGTGQDSATITFIASSIDAFVLKMNTDGEIIWAKQWSGNSTVFGQTLSIDVFGNAVISGGFSGTMDADSGPGIFELQGSQSTFLVKLDAFGNFIWAGTIAGSSSGVNSSITTNPLGDIHVTGGFRYTADLDPNEDTLNLTSNGYYDAFVLKLSNCVTFMDSYDAQGCNQFTSPSGNYTWTESGIYNDYVAYGSGCDSVFTIDLTVVETDNSIGLDIGSLTLSSNGINDSYQWLNCNENYAAVSGETEQSFQVTQDGSYAVQINTEGCVDTSDCLMIIGVGIAEKTFAEQLSVFPNPTNGELTIELGETMKNLTLNVWNAKGKLVSDGSFNSVERLNTEIAGEDGIYLLELTTERGERALFKVIKQER
ncbi:MAG: T9SS type A sorting domain-containing protein, partial [Flavobacteriales bacterium]|nr:T9SS type A sorting domain-containing protein [Flavobacteriales bacterium]